MRIVNIIYILLTLLNIFVSGASAFAQQTRPPAALQKVLTEELNWPVVSVENLIITDQYISGTNEIHHYYIQSTIDGIPLLGAVGNIHLSNTNKLVFHNTRQPDTPFEDLIWPNFPMPSIEDWLNSWQNQNAPLSELRTVQPPRQCWYPATPPRPAVETLVYAGEDLWQLVYSLPDGELLYSRLLSVYCNLSCSAEQHFPSESQVLTETSKGETTVALPPSFIGSYSYFPSDAVSPVYGDRVITSAASLIDPIAAPHGWHDADGNANTIEYNYTQGNHVYAHYSPDDLDIAPPVGLTYAPNGTYLAGNVPSPVQTLEFNYENDLEPDDPREALPDAITNLFVWNNLCHDILYRHGFDEAAGNFQDLNFSSSGGAGDAVDARAQSGNGINNATFSTPPDGTSPIMRMFLWDTNLSGNFRDAAFDNVIIAHEYAHGLSFRLVGGPSNITCLANFEQGGEGWSDIVGLLLNLQDINGNTQMEEAILGEGVRSIGNYVINQGANDTGLRAQYYTTEMDCSAGGYCNDLTYDQLDQLRVPHGVGTLWGTILWDFCWALINEYGFEADLSSGNTTAGNIRALRSIIAGLKMTACNPTFLEMRDALLAGYRSLYGQADDEAIWAVFARRGLGVSAQAGGIAAFDTPTAFLTKTVDKPVADIGESVTYTITVDNNSGIALSQVSIQDDFDPILQVTSISDGGTQFGNSIVWPPVSMSNGSSVSRQFTATVNTTNGATVYLSEPVEDPSLSFVPLGLWVQDGGQTNPSTGSTSAWWHPSLPLFSESYLLMNIDRSNGGDILSFWQWHDNEAGVDGGTIEIQQGAGWSNLHSRILEYDYNGYIYDEIILPNGMSLPFTALSGESAYTGYSGGWKRTVVDLSGYSEMVTIRFRYAADESTDTGNCDGPSTACGGWYLDDFELLDRFFLLNEACVTSSEGYGSCGNLGQVGTIYFSGAVLPVEWLTFKASPQGKKITLNWTTIEDQTHQGYWLERKLETEQVFKKIAWIEEPHSQHSNKYSYQFDDLDVVANTTYIYRLQQEDADGTFSYSPLRSARITQTNSWQVFPNPSRGAFYLFNNESEGQNWLLQIYTPTGKLVQQQILIPNQRIENTDIPAGLYFLRLFNEQEEQFLRWTKQ